MRRMYSTFFTCVSALAVSAAAADAQTIGFKLGAAFSTLQVDEPTTTQNSITGFIGGGHARVNIAGRLGLQAELLSVTKGADIRGTPDFDLRFEYIEVPLLLHVPLTTGMAFAPYVYGGPSIAFEVRCRTTDTAGTASDCTDVSPFERRSTDIGLVAGGGLAFAMGPGALLLEGRYTWGMTNLNAANDVDASTVRNRSGAILAGYEINIGRRW
jgi:hypothetical protein